VALVRASHRVYASLREEIVSGRLPPGTELGEVEQSARLGVSRTPLREALARLAAEGLAVAGRGRTLVVPGLSAADVVHLFELREALETQAARLAARRGDPTVFVRLRERFGAAAGEAAQDRDRTAYYALVADLDAAIDDAAHSPYLRRSLAALHGHVARARRLSQDDPDRLARAATEHAVIAGAIADGDATFAAQATAVHLRASLDAVLATLAALATDDGGAPATATAHPSLTAAGGHR